MKFGKIISVMVSLISPISSESDCERYVKLEIKNTPSIKKSDLPDDFSDEAFEVVDEFIRKTIDLDYEILIY